MHSFGETYLEHREKLEFSIEQHQQLFNICREVGIGYSVSVWDVQSAQNIISLEPDYIKIPSAMNENYKLLDYLFENFNKDIHISLGMISKENRETLYKYLEDKKDRVVMYWTTSGYPVPFDELYLLELVELKKIFPRISFSGHHRGIAIDIAAFVLGNVEFIERHFTLDRTSKGSDHSASLEPLGLQRLCRDLKAVQKSLSFKKIDYTEDEKINMKKLKVKG